MTKTIDIILIEPTLITNRIYTGSDAIDSKLSKMFKYVSKQNNLELKRAKDYNKLLDIIDKSINLN